MTTDSGPQVSPAEALTARCPKCGAVPSQPCQTVEPWPGRVKEYPHGERYGEARKNREAPDTYEQAGIPVVIDESVGPDKVVLRTDGQPDTVVRLPSKDVPDIFEVIVGQVQFAVRQIDGALEDTRLNEIGELWLRKVRETLTMEHEVFGSPTPKESST